MNRILVVCSVLLMALVAASAAADTRVSIGFDLGNAPPPPRIYFHSQPHFRYVPADEVYVIDDDDLGSDMFRCNGFYYVYNDGYWYQSSSYRGPFVVVRADYVPRQIFTVSDHDYRWRHRPEWSPPGRGHGKHGWKQDWKQDGKHDWKHGDS